eukprot:CFRG3982T1
MVSSCERRTVLQAGQTTIKYNVDGKVILIGGLGGNMMLFNDVNDDDPIDIEAHESDIRDIACHKQMIVTCGDDHRAEMRTFPDGDFEEIVFRSTLPILTVSFSKDGSIVAVGACTGEAKLVRSNNPASSVMLTGDETAVRDMAIDPKGEFVATVSISGFVRIFKVDGTKIHEKLIHDALAYDDALNKPFRIGWSHDGQLLGLPNGHTFMLLQRGSWEELSLPENLSKSTIDIVAFSPTDKLLATADSAGAVVVYSSVTSDPSVVHRFQNDASFAITGLDWHPSGGAIVWADNQGAWGVFGDIDAKRAYVDNEQSSTPRSSNNIYSHSKRKATSEFASEAEDNDTDNMDDTKKYGSGIVLDSDAGESLDGQDFEAVFNEFDTNEGSGVDTMDAVYPPTQARPVVQDIPSPARKKVLVRKKGENETVTADRITLSNKSTSNSETIHTNDIDVEIEIDDVDEAGMFKIDGIDDYDDIAIPEHARTEPPKDVREPLETTVKKLKSLQQETFQPSSTTEPDQSKRRFLCWNMDASIVNRVEDDYASIDIEFADSMEHSSVKIVDNFGYTLGAVNMTCAVLASPIRKKAPSTIQCKMFDAWAGNADWTHQLPTGEEIIAVAVGSRWVAAATNMNYLRIFSASGCQMAIQSIPGRCVSMAGDGPLLAIAYIRGFAFEDQNMDFVLLNVLDETVESRVMPLSLSPQCDLEWMGFTSEGVPATYDSMGIVRILTSKNFSPWMPVMDMREKFNDENRMWAWIIGITSQEVIYVVCRGGARFPSATHRPVVSESVLVLPLCGVDLGSGKLEEEWVRTSAMSNLKNKEDEKFKPSGTLAARLDSNRLRLMQLALQQDRPLRVMDLACMLHLPKSYSIAIQLMSRDHKPELAKRISILLQAREQQIAEEEDIEARKKENTTVIYMANPSAAQQTAISMNPTLDLSNDPVVNTMPKPVREKHKLTLPPSTAFANKNLMKKKGKGAMAVAKRSMPGYRPPKKKLRPEPRCETFSDEDRDDELDTEDPAVTYRERATSTSESTETVLHTDSEDGEDEYPSTQSTSPIKTNLSNVDESPMRVNDFRPSAKVNPFASNKSPARMTIDKSSSFFNSLGKLHPDNATPSKANLRSVGSVMGKDSFRKKSSTSNTKDSSEILGNTTKKQASLAFTKKNPFTKSKAKIADTDKRSSILSSFEFKKADAESFESSKKNISNNSTPNDRLFSSENEPGMGCEVSASKITESEKTLARESIESTKEGKHTVNSSPVKSGVTANKNGKQCEQEETQIIDDEGFVLPDTLDELSQPALAV